jgi:hypothetical protein
LNEENNSLKAKLVEAEKNVIRAQRQIAQNVKKSTGISASA